MGPGVRRPGRARRGARGEGLRFRESRPLSGGPAALRAQKRRGEAAPTGTTASEHRARSFDQRFDQRSPGRRGPSGGMAIEAHPGVSTNEAHPGVWPLRPIRGYAPHTHRERAVLGVPAEGGGSRTPPRSGPRQGRPASGGPGRGGGSGRMHGNRCSMHVSEPFSGSGTLAGLLQRPGWGVRHAAGRGGAMPPPPRARRQRPAARREERRAVCGGGALAKLDGGTRDLGSGDWLRSTVRPGSQRRRRPPPGGGGSDWRRRAARADSSRDYQRGQAHGGAPTPAGGPLRFLQAWFAG